MKKPLTQKEKILFHMFSKLGKQVRFYAYDFMPPRMPMEHPCFVGYEASARMTDVASDYHDLVETKMDGKYRVMRIRPGWHDAWHNLSVHTKNLIFAALPDQEDTP